MNNTEEKNINSLFIKLEAATKAEKHFNSQSLFAPANREVYNQVFEETLEEIFHLQKRIIRALLRAGAVGELLSHIEAGTFPRYSIQAAMGRI